MFASLLLLLSDFHFILQALSKKESKGGMDSPLGDDSDHEGDFSLTPRTEAKYNKIDEEFHLMMQRNQLNGARVGLSSGFFREDVTECWCAGRPEWPGPGLLHASHGPRQLQLQLGLGVAAHLAPAAAAARVAAASEPRGRAPQRLPAGSLARPRPRQPGPGQPQAVRGLARPAAARPRHEQEQPPRGDPSLGPRHRPRPRLRKLKPRTQFPVRRVHGASSAALESNTPATK